MPTNTFGITPDLLVLVKASEGLRLEAYLDPAGLPTIGYGHRVDSMAYPPIIEAEANQLLQADLEQARDHLMVVSPSLFQVTQPRVAALTDFVFNLGVGHYRHSTLRRVVDVHDWPGAAVQVQRWVYGHAAVSGAQIKLPGLVTRRAAEAQWLIAG